MLGSPVPDPISVTMLLYGEVDHDPRVRREARSLVAAGYRLTIATLTTRSRTPYVLDGARIVPVRPGHRWVVPGDQSPYHGETGRSAAVRRLASRAQWAIGYGGTFYAWLLAVQRRLPAADVWHGHDLLGLLAAQRMQRMHGGHLVYDSHELFLEAGSAPRLPRPARAALARLERRAVRACELVITVNSPIAEELRRRYGAAPIVVMNCPELLRVRPVPVMRDRLQLGDRHIAMYHGAVAGGRGLETLVRSIPYLPSGCVVVVLGPGAFATRLREIAIDLGVADRFLLVPQVPIDEVPAWIADADVGVIPFEPVDQNNVMGTPNKLFEYLEAGVPVVTSDFPAMRAIVEATGAGQTAVAGDPSSFGAAITRVLGEPVDARSTRRNAARTAAETTYNWAAQAEKLMVAYGDLACGREDRSASLA